MFFDKKNHQKSRSKGGSPTPLYTPFKGTPKGRLRDDTVLGFDSLDGVLPTPSQDRAMSAPMFSRRGGLACGPIEGLRPVAVPPYGLSSGAWHDRDPAGGSPRGLMAVTLRPGQSSIVDLRSQCTDGLLLLSTTASFVPRAQAQAAC